MESKNRNSTRKKIGTYRIVTKEKNYCNKALSSQVGTINFYYNFAKIIKNKIRRYLPGIYKTSLGDVKICVYV